MGERRAFGALGLRNGVAELPERLGLGVVGGDHRVGDQPLLERRGEQPLELGGDVVSRVGGGRFDQHVPGDARPSAAGACRGCA